MAARRILICRAVLLMVLGVPVSVAQAQRLDTVGVVPPWDVAFLSDARSVRVDPAERVYVADAAGTIVVLSPQGSLLQTITGNERAPLRAPEDLDPTNGLLLLVADPGAGRIYRFGDDGLVLESLGGGEAPRLGRFDGTPDDTFTPVAVASNARNDVFALDAAKGRLLRWDLSRQRTTLSGPEDGVLVDPHALAAVDDRLYVLDRRGVVMFDTFGTVGRRFAARHAPEALRVRAVDGEGGRMLVLVLPQALALYNAEGGLEGVLSWDGPPLRDVAFGADMLYLLTARTLYRIER